MRDVKVSIITVCYNSELTIERTIKSVLDQTYDNIEYVIVDGDSNDSTMSIVHKYEHIFGSGLRVISEKDNGIYDAMNKGIDMSTGELIGIINSDDWYEHTAVEAMVNAYNEHPGDKAIVFYGYTGTIDDGKLISVTRASDEKLEEKMISHPSCFITRRAYEDLGKYNTEYPSVADYDLMLRFKKSNKVEFVPVDAHIANFSLGGMSSTGRAYIDLLKLKMNYNMISKIRGNIEIFKAKLAMDMERHGMKPIRLRKR